MASLRSVRHALIVAPRLDIGLAIGLVMGLVLGTASAQDSPELVLTLEQIELAKEFSPLPDPPADPTNAVADDPAAARFGQALFFDPRLSGPGDISCSSCHTYEQGWGDERPLAEGIVELDRHAMTLWNVAYNRWFFWGGRKDTLWSQALDPLEDPREHGGSRLAVAHVLHDDPAYARAYAQVFGPLPELADEARFPSQGRPVRGDRDHPHAVAWASMSADDQLAVDRVYTNVGKALAAYQRLLVSRRAPFDVFVEGLEEDDPEKLAALSPAAQRGFGLFLGKGQCLLCHDGPTFSDREFHGNRVPLSNISDPGRAQGISRLMADPFNSNSAFADDGGRMGRTRLNIAPRGFHLPGDFKTPSLRNVAVTAPYMHEGQFAKLEDVIHFYSTMEGAAAADPTGEQILLPREFTEQEQADLLAFLHALTDESLPEALRGPPDSPELPSGDR
jgi:cytochrome c peroxidase